LFADLRQILFAATRRRRLLLAALTAPLAVATLYLSLSPAHYTAVLPVTFRLAGETTDAAPLGSDAELRRLTSREVLRRLAEIERTAVAAERRPELARLLLGAGRTPLSTDALTERLAHAIAVKPTPASARFEIEIHADSQEEAARLARGLRETLADAATQERALAAEADSKRQVRRLTELQSRMEDAARRLSAFRDANPNAATEDVLAPLATGSPAGLLQEAKARRIAAQTRLARAEAALRAGAKGFAPDRLPDSPAMEKLRADYAAQTREAELATANLLPRHPDYLAAMARLAAAKERLLAETRRIEQSARRDLDAAAVAEKHALKEVADPSTERAATDSGEELASLREEATKTREAYEAALLHGPAKTTPARTPEVETVVGEPRVTRDPTTPSPAMLFGAATAFGLLMWLGESARRDLAAAPRAPEPEAATAIPLPKFAGALRRRRSGPRQRAREIVETPGEPYRAAVAGLYRLLAKRRGLETSTPTILVKARAPGAGASTLALALAFFAAGRGERILLVTGGPQAPAKAHDYAGGEIMLAPGRAADPRLADLREATRYDLIIIDGADDTPAAPIDATLIVARDAKTGERKAQLLREERAPTEPRLARAA
jgi:uncharacterized protein involved in exopolysaccharide biosynthesis